MTLKHKSRQLLQTLREIFRHLDRSGGAHATHLTARLARRVEALAAALDVDHPVPCARDVLADITPVMEDVSGAATNGEPPLFPDPSLLDNYWDFRTDSRTPLA